MLDAGALVAFERGEERIRALLRHAVATRARVVVPSGVLGQVWRGGARQVALRALVASSICETPPLDRVMAQAAGALCGRAGTSDLIDASVVLTARRERAPVLTADVDDLRRLDPTLTLVRV